MGDAQSEAAGVSAELHERLPQLKAQVEDVASARRTLTLTLTLTLI